MLALTLRVRVLIVPVWAPVSSRVKVPICAMSSLLTVLEATQCGLDGGLEATGRPVRTVRPQRERRTAAAELLASRGRRGTRRGRKSAEPLRARGRTGARPAIQRGRLALPRTVPRETTRSTPRAGERPH